MVTESTTTPLMSLGDLDLFLNEWCRSFDKAVESLSSTFVTLMSLYEFSVAEIVPRGLCPNRSVVHFDDLIAPPTGC